MEKICPICNKITTEVLVCDECGGKMEDRGRRQDYWDAYGADVPIMDEKDYCLHIFVCEKCGKEKKCKILKVNF